jgi:uncharacterized damage-inducible protein DinB
MHLLDQLHQTRRQTLEYFDLPDSELEKSYAPGKWTIRQILNHLADAETVLYDRVRRAISEPGSVLWAFDQDRWCEQLQYSTFPLAINKGIYSAVRAGVVELVRQHYAQSETKTFVHSETGLRTLKEEFEKIALHNAHHLEQIQRALEA